MTLVSTQWGTVALALTGLLRAQDGWRAPTDAFAGITVYFGPEVDSFGDRAGSYVVVAWPGDDSGEHAQAPGSLTQTPAALTSSHPREEDGEITCMAVAQDGGTDFPGVLTTAEGLLAAVESLLRTTPTLGLPAATVRQVTFTAGTPTLMRVAGAVCMYEFRVSYRARLGVS